ncbi:hypothetical protein G7B40_039105 [Aetokthonos hydrillicola Thurmond2011]|uniref:Uncharacterized protein n=1 Tax=Aetokthonos hydrillicola Thurmond2011 TaxID=2712845 RepID=A0AAP5MBQ6_9CYAN|nr:hypothetical protein [Aetokthonos hydrillicola]MBO3457780.1 hypothetical protein [Aetokthonos hydrillicola CCALA 1050]MDR9897154.1 hypothetical protein [Aetokthonos hydrillicola Thurmond2011]MDR9900514.1 hypothetical protein [Aetokthonos hydrillicola Thurmond2011]
MNQTDTTLTPEALEIWRALDEIDQDPCIGNLTEEQKNVLFDQFFSKEAKMARLQRVQRRKQDLEEQLTSLLAMEKQLLESLQE